MAKTFMSIKSLNINIKTSSNFLRYVHNFRGVAILVIVASHVIDFLEYDNKLIEKIAYSLITNGTIYFVFIAGFLFQFLSYNYEYKNYLIKKLQYVLLPYLFISIPGIALCLIGELTTPDWFINCFSDWQIHLQILMYLLTGAHVAPFWFIPMIAIFYITSPILLWIDTHPKVYQIVLILLILTVVIPRAEHNDNAMQSYIHFLSAYVLGMFCSHFREKIFPVMQKKYFWLLIGFVVLTVLEIVFLPQPTVQPTTINSLTKLVLCVLIMYFLWVAESRLSKLFHEIMGLLAELSFGIYFIHYYFLMFYSRMVYKLRLEPFWIHANPFIFSLILVFGLGGSIVLLLFIKMIFGKKSRFIVGC